MFPACSAILLSWSDRLVRQGDGQPTDDAGAERPTARKGQVRPTGRPTAPDFRLLIPRPTTHDPPDPRPTGDAVPAETHMEKGPLERDQVLELIRDLLADILEIEPSAISESSSFAEDLDADSLALIELVEGLEEELGERSVGFRIDDEDLEELRTVRDSVDYVYAKLGGA